MQIKEIKNEAVENFIDDFAQACDAKIDALRTEAYQISSNDSVERQQLASRLIQMSNDIENAKRMVLRFQKDYSIKFGGLAIKRKKDDYQASQVFRRICDQDFFSI